MLITPKTWISFFSRRLRNGKSIELWQGLASTGAGTSTSTRIPFFVEFPAGPLGIGRDLAVKPIQHKFPASGSAIRILSATDSCRDRLAAFYHWNDRQSLDAAVLIAVRNRVNMRKIQAWSTEEDAAEGFREFSRELARARGRTSRSPAS